MRTTRVLALVAALVASLSIVAPARAASNASENAGSFIVTLKESADPRSVASEYRRDGADIEHVYDRVLNGFAGRFDSSSLGRLQADGRVERIERDGVATTTDVASWGLDRIDQQYLALDDTFVPNGDGAGVHVYVIDTGILAGHDEFNENGVRGVGVGDDEIKDGNGTNDCNGHGTHVAGTIGGERFGVAPAVTLHPVRVLGCTGSGTWSGVIGGMNWVAEQVDPDNNGADFAAVANMSLGGGLSSSVNTAAGNLANVVTLAVAAGNDNRDACNFSPASATGVLTVAATAVSDTRASYSNWGGCVELFAPGSSITSAWIDSTSDTNTISGTSMATPHVAGVAATLASGKSVGAVKSLLTTGGANVTPGAVTSVNGSPNQLLFNGAPTNHAPTITIAATCSGTTCTFTATGREPDAVDATSVAFAWTGAAKQGESAVVAGKETSSATASVSTGYEVSATVTAGGLSRTKSDTATVRMSCTRKGSKVTCRSTTIA